MSYQPSGFQTLFLWRLLANGGGAFLRDTKPKLDPKKDRKPLEAAGLIAIEKRPDPFPKKRAQKINYAFLTEKGWEWAAEHLDAEVSDKSPAAGPILRDILTKLKTHLKTHHVSLADFITAPAEKEGDGGQPSAEAPAPEPAVQEAAVAPGGDVRGRIRDGYGKLAEGKWNTRVRLADLRAALWDVSRETFDEALLGMEGDGAVVLFPLDNPQEIRPEDERAALRNAAGFPRHVMYMEG